MTYQQAVDYILDIPKFTRKNKPEHTRIFLEYLGNPQRRMKVIHVAGTNGKGSVCVYLDAMLRSEGKTVGLFTSPHLVRMNERIVTDGKPISDACFLEVFESVLEKVGEMERQGLPHPTFFEFLFGMAVTAFDRAGVEYAVLETGLGGRLDATNSVEHPVCTAIAAIGLDHTDILGETLEEIAAEKAGIMKPGTPMFYSEGEEQSNRVIEEKASELGISCKKIEKNAFKILGIENKRIAFSCANAYYEDITWRLQNIGCYQPENAMLALEVMRGLFGAQGHPSRWREALEHVTWEGRMEEVLPDIYVDGAHNISAVRRFTETISDIKAGKLLLFSAVQDKDYEDMIACLCEEVDADGYVVTHISDKRAADVQVLADVFRRYTDKPVIVKEALKEAWDYVLAEQKGRQVYCLGSLYLAGMIKTIMEDSRC